VVDKSLKELRQVADHAVILERGASVWSGTMDTLSEAVTQKYLGV
jgi:branched-chain amino acid transport system ATP-binding protein